MSTPRHADEIAAPPKCDRASLEHPFFALRAGEKNARAYERETDKVKAKITVTPDAKLGCATQHDKDLWIYCVGLIMAAKNRGENIDRTVHFRAHEFFVATGRGRAPARGWGGRDYREFYGLLRRMKGTLVETDIKTGGQREREGFSLIDSWRVIEHGEVVGVEVVLPNWLFRAAAATEVLTVAPEYFCLRSSLARRLYELGRRHCGHQPKFTMSLVNTREKCGSTATLKEFRRQVKSIVEDNNLPGYIISYDQDTGMVTWRNRNPAKAAQKSINVEADTAAAVEG